MDGADYSPDYAMLVDTFFACGEKMVRRKPTSFLATTIVDSATFPLLVMRNFVSSNQKKDENYSNRFIRTH